MPGKPKVFHDLLAAFLTRTRVLQHLVVQELQQAHRNFVYMENHHGHLVHLLVWERTLPPQALHLLPTAPQAVPIHTVLLTLLVVLHAVLLLRAWGRTPPLPLQLPQAPNLLRISTLLTTMVLLKVCPSLRL